MSPILLQSGRGGAPLHAELARSTYETTVRRRIARRLGFEDRPRSDQTTMLGGEAGTGHIRQRHASND